jgi:hypothetical protein
VKKLLPKTFKTFGEPYEIFKAAKIESGFDWLLFDALVPDEFFNYHLIPLPASVSY